MIVSSAVTTSVESAYRHVREETEALASPLGPEDCQAQSMECASPVKWHLAHTTWFFETFVLLELCDGYERWDASTDLLFNSYYETVGERIPRPQRGLMTRPSLAEVLDYRHHVDRALLQFFERLPDHERASDVAARVELGFHHEQQHQELILTDVKHLLSLNPLRPAYREDRAGDVAAPVGGIRWLEHPGGNAEIGRDDGDGFGYDNESPRHRRHVHPFRMADRLVTCGEYLEFVEAGGYEDARHWLSDGWATVQSEGWRHPLYWNRDAIGGWHVFTLAGERPLRCDEPVCHVSFYEADAYARWAGARLPREDEWEIVAAPVPVDGNFLESRALHPLPASPKRDPSRPSSLFGDLWEWTGSPYTAYPGYAPAEGALGEYNGKFMCNQFVLRGGSCGSPQSHLRATYRNFFPAAARWQFSGIRLARDV